jgi:glycosyltransferase involved in cell wall biosynthesis
LFDLDYDQAARSFRARLGIPESRRLVGFAGNFGRKQHLRELIEAARGLPADFTTVLVGDGPEKPELERIARLGPADVRVLRPQPANDLYSFLSACDVSLVVAWTRYTGSLFPSKVANVLAAGSPIAAITARGTELATLLQNEDLGVVCPSLNPEDIRDAVRCGADLGRDQRRRSLCRGYARRYLSRAQAMVHFLTQVHELVGQ